MDEQTKDDLDVDFSVYFEENYSKTIRYAVFEFFNMYNSSVVNFRTCHILSLYYIDSPTETGKTETQSKKRVWGTTMKNRRAMNQKFRRRKLQSPQCMINLRILILTINTHCKDTHQKQ